MQLDALGPWAETCPELERAPVLLLAALVKEFFRALPQPLLAAELYPAWLQVLSEYLWKGPLNNFMVYSFAYV